HGRLRRARHPLGDDLRRTEARTGHGTARPGSGAGANGDLGRPAGQARDDRSIRQLPRSSRLRVMPPMSMSKPMNTDIFTQDIISDALVAVGYEMFDAMVRTSMSPIIYESTDFAVGVTDARGNLLAQGNGVAAFLATLDTAVQSALTHYPSPGDVEPGDVIITNIPYEGG